MSETPTSPAIREGAPPLVSVVVPTYKRADRLGPVLRSVLDQTLQDFEIVVVDDASRDGTEAVVAAIGDERIHLVTHETNRGGNAARRTGISHSSGRYVAFLDSDDLWLPDKLRQQVDLLEAKGPGYGLCGCWYVIEDPAGHELSRVEPELDGLAVPAMYVANWLGSYSAVMVARDVLDLVGGPDPHLRSCQDWELFLRVNAVTGVCCVPETLVRYLADDADPVRISGRRESVLSGHRRIFDLVRGAHLGDEVRVASAVTFLRVFAANGSPIDVARVLTSLPAHVWTRRGVTHAAHMFARSVRRRAALARG